MSPSLIFFLILNLYERCKRRRSSSSHLGFAPGSKIRGEDRNQKKFLRDRGLQRDTLRPLFYNRRSNNWWSSFQERFLNNIISEIVIYRNRYLAGDAILEVESYQESSLLPNDSRTILCTMPTIIVATINVSFRRSFPTIFPPFFFFLLLFSLPFLLFFFLFPRSRNNDRYYIRVPSRCYQLRPSSDVTRRISKRFVS